MARHMAPKLGNIMYADKPNKLKYELFDLKFPLISQSVTSQRKTFHFTVMVTGQITVIFATSSSFSLC